MSTPIPSSVWPRMMFPHFFFNDTATTEIYTLSLHDALPIYSLKDLAGQQVLPFSMSFTTAHGSGARTARSEEHTSELQSHSDLVCRLLLEKKKNHILVAEQKLLRRNDVDAVDHGEHAPVRMT